MNTPRTLSTIALAASLLCGYHAQAQSVKTETDIQQTSVRKGTRLHRTQVITDDFVLRYDAKTNLSSKDNQLDVGGIYADGIFKSGNVSVGAALTTLGNYDKSHQIVFDGWATLNYDQWKATFEKGHSVRKTAPMEFDILTVRNYTNNFKAAAQVFLVSNNGSMYNGQYGKDANGNTNKEFHGFIAAGNASIAGSYAENNGTSHLFGTARHARDVGAFFWARTHRSKKDWSVRVRSAAGNIEDKFFTYETVEDVTNRVGQPALYETHLKPGVTRGDISLSMNIAGTPGLTTAEFVPGVRTGVIDFGVGPYMEWRNNATSTGIAAAAYGECTLAGVKGSVELTYNGITTPVGRRDDVAGYVTLSKNF